MSDRSGQLVDDTNIDTTDDEASDTAEGERVDKVYLFPLYLTIFS